MMHELFKIACIYGKDTKFIATILIETNQKLVELRETVLQVWAEIDNLLIKNTLSVNTYVEDADLTFETSHVAYKVI